MSEEIKNIEEFKKLQRMAYQGAREICDQLTEGVTEIEVADQFEQWWKERGIDRFFHRPFAWFGERTHFDQFAPPFRLKEKGQWQIKWPTLKNKLPHFGKEFSPTNRKLKNNESVIVDVAPIDRGVTIDIGYSYFFSPKKDSKSYQTFEFLKKELRHIRKMIVERVNQNKTGTEIYREIDDYLETKKIANRHKMYPSEVLGHRLDVIDQKLPNISVMGFGLEAYYDLGKKFVHSLNDKPQNPLFSPYTDWPLEKGLWAIEPHIEKDGVGVKFEEILVVDKNKAYWAEDDLW